MKTGLYMPNEFGARGRQRSVRRWGRLLGWGWLRGRGRLVGLGGLGLRLGGFGVGASGLGFGGGRKAVVVVAVDGVADGFAPAVGAEGVDVFVLGDVDGLHEGLDQISDGVGGFGFYIAADNGRDEACQGGAEIAGGEVVAGEEVGQVFAEFLCGAGSGFFLGVVEAEAGIVAGARSAATAAIRESKRTQTHAVLWTESGHKSLLRVEFWDCGSKAGRAEARPYTEKEHRLKPVPPARKNAGKMPALQKRNASRGREAQYATEILYHNGMREQF